MAANSRSSWGGSKAGYCRRITDLFESGTCASGVCCKTKTDTDRDRERSFSMPEQDLIQVARENVEAWTEGNWQRLRAALAPDVAYDEVGTQRRVQGADQLIKVYQDWKKASPDGKGTVTKDIASGDTVVLEVTWKATHNGTIETPGGIIPPSGKQWTIQAAQVIKIQNG